MISKEWDDEKETFVEVERPTITVKQLKEFLEKIPDDFEVGGVSDLGQNIPFDLKDMIEIEEDKKLIIIWINLNGA